jgi:hypothetical protein
LLLKTAEQLGAVRAIAKPFLPSEIVTAVKEILAEK